MSTISGVFPNAITPTFAPSTDPASQSRLRRENETAVFLPIDEVEQNAATRRTAIEQPGRLEAEQATRVASQTARPAVGVEAQVDEIEQPLQSQSEANVQGKTATDQRQSPDDQAAREEQRRVQDDQRAEQEQAKLEQEIELVRELAARDREVRAHEQAHQSVGGQYAGAMNFTFKQGPDGKRYAVGGEVPIDVSKVPGDPQATAQKAERIQRAALAPAEPSAQDRQVAALAAQISIEAQNDLRQMERQEAEKTAQERAEQKALSEESTEKTEKSSSQDEEKSDQAASEKDDRLDEIFKRTSDAIESALDAAYRRQPQQEIGFNLDTTI